MKSRISQPSCALALVLVMAAGIGSPACANPSIQSYVPFGTPSQAELIPTVVVRASRSNSEAMATVVVTAVKNGSDSIRPLLVLFVTMLFGGILLRLRQASRKLKA